MYSTPVNRYIPRKGRVGGGVFGREGVPGHELLHQGEEQLEAQTRYEQTTTLA